MENSQKALPGSFPPNAAQSYELMREWLDSGFRNLEKIATHLRTMAGTGEVSLFPPAYAQALGNVVDQVKQFQRRYIDLLGAVPREDYLAATQRHTELEAQIASNEAVSKQLQALMAELREFTRNEMARQLEDLVQREQVEMEKLREGVGEMIRKSAPKSHPAPRGKSKQA